MTTNTIELEPKNRLGLALHAMREWLDCTLSFARQAMYAGVSENTIRSIAGGSRPSLKTALGLARLLTDYGDGLDFDVGGDPVTIDDVMKLYDTPFRGRRKRTRCYKRKT